MKVTFLNKQKNRKTITCNDGEKLLHAGLRQGIPLPYECGTGHCGTCIARAKPGTVQPNNPDFPGSKNLNHIKGEFLLCQCSVYGDCEILVDSKDLIQNHKNPLPSHHNGHLHNFKIVAPDVYVAHLELENPIDYVKGVEGKKIISIEDIENVAVLVSKTNGKKCQRCWKYEQQLFNEDLCNRCSDAIK